MKVNINVGIRYEGVLELHEFKNDLGSKLKIKTVKKMLVNQQEDKV